MKQIDVLSGDTALRQAIKESVERNEAVLKLLEACEMVDTVMSEEDVDYVIEAMNDVYRTHPHLSGRV